MVARSKANKSRGEHELTLGGKLYPLRPSHAAIETIEAQTGCSLLTLVRKGNVGDLSLAQLGVIAAELIRAGADEKDTMTQAVAAERIGELIYEQGAIATMPRLTLCLVDAAAGGRTASGEAKPVAGPTT